MDELQRKHDDIRFKELVIKYRNGNKESLTELVILCEPLVKHMSRKYYNLAMSKNIPIEDLKQECYVGLLGAISRFPTNVDDNSFRSYACSAMNYQVLYYFRNHSDRIVKTNSSKGCAEFESMNKEQSSFGELEDLNSNVAFKEIEDNIDKQIQKENVNLMLDDILYKHSDVPILRDMYGLDGQSYSISEICNKYNLTLNELILKERFMVLKIKNSKKIKNYIPKLDYTPRAAFKYGVQRFKDTWVSSTEFIAMQHIEYEEKNKALVSC